MFVNPLSKLYNWLSDAGPDASAPHASAGHEGARDAAAPEAVILDLDPPGADNRSSETPDKAPRKDARRDNFGRVDLYLLDSVVGGAARDRNAKRMIRDGRSAYFDDEIDADAAWGATAPARESWDRAQQEGESTEPGHQENESATTPPGKRKAKVGPRARKAARGAVRGPSASAEIDRLIKRLHTLGNRVRLKYIMALRELHDSKLYLGLGHPNFHAYCERELGLPRSTAYEYVRAAKSLDELSRLREMFSGGSVSWAQVREITRIANPTTEIEWIKFALEHSSMELRADVQAALLTGRKTPGSDGTGLPNLLINVRFKVTLEDHELLRTACAIIQEAWGEDDSTGGQRHALVRLAEAVVAGAVQVAPPKGAGAAPATSASVTYQSCPQCKTATVQTADGKVEISPERLEAVAKWARKQKIAPKDEQPTEKLPDGQKDAVTPAWLRRKVLQRDGHRCTNPRCRSRHKLHVHHIDFRYLGGRTVLANLTTVCAMCHALIHKGLLSARWGPDRTLKWRTLPNDPSVDQSDVDDLIAQFNEIDGSGSPEPGSESPAEYHSQGNHRAPAPAETAAETTESPAETGPFGPSKKGEPHPPSPETGLGTVPVETRSSEDVAEMRSSESPAETESRKSRAGMGFGKPGAETRPRSSRRGSESGEFGRTAGSTESPMETALNGSVARTGLDR